MVIATESYQEQLSFGSKLVLFLLLRAFSAEALHFPILGRPTGFGGAAGAIMWGSTCFARWLLKLVNDGVNACECKGFMMVNDGITVDY